MTVSFWLRPHSQLIPDMSADILIVGGGFVGLSTAYWISELNPAAKVIVLERGSLGAGASGRNAGFLTKGSAFFYKGLGQKWGTQKALEILKFAESSLSLVHQHFLKESSTIDFTETTSMTLFQNEQAHQNWKDSHFDDAVFNFVWKKKDELPKSLQNKFYGALETAPEYKVAPLQLLQALKKKLEERKIKIIEHTSAFKLTAEGVLTETNVIHAKKVVLALNGYFPEFHASFKSLITPRRAQMMAVELLEDFDCPSLYYDSPERVYWRKVSDKILLVGGKRILDIQGEEGGCDKISPVIQTGLENYLSKQLGVKYKVLQRWSGTMGFTDHELPILSQFKAPLETYVVGGFSGHGMGLGFRSGLETAELVTGSKTTSIFQSFKDSQISL